MTSQAAHLTHFDPSTLLMILRLELCDDVPSRWLMDLLWFQSQRHWVAAFGNSVQQEKDVLWALQVEHLDGEVELATSSLDSRDVG